MHKQHNQPYLIHKYLDNYYRNVHRHLHHKDTQDRNITQEIRDHRNRTWWKAILFWTHSQRAKEDATQRRQGLFPEHEDLITVIQGEGWRHKALRMNKKDWVRDCRHNAQTYLIDHHLPPNPIVKTTPNNNNGHNNPEAGQHHKKQRNQPHNHTHDNDNNNQQQNNTTTSDDNNEGANELWPTPSNTFRVIVDNKQLCDTICGIATLTYETNEDYHVCSDIVDMLVQFKNIGYSPAAPHLEPIEWRKRGKNKGADRWCNEILDHNTNYFHHYHHMHQHPHTTNDSNNNNNNNNSNNATTAKYLPNLFIQSDGGCRYNGFSSTGWRIIAVTNNQQQPTTDNQRPTTTNTATATNTSTTTTTTTIAEGGSLHNGDRTSFSIECRALQEVFRIVLICVGTIFPPSRRPVQGGHLTLRIEGMRK